MDKYFKSKLCHSKSLSGLVLQATANQKPLMELTESQKEKLKTVAGITLALIAAAGTITVAAIAPNILQAVAKIHKQTKKSKLSFKEKRIKTAHTFYYLKRYNLIQLRSSPKGLIATLTDRGKKHLEKLSFNTLQIPREKKWDGKWWLIAADIPTKEYRWAADLFRSKIKQMQLFPLQRTMWFYPYNPAREIEFLANHYGIGQYVTTMEVSRLDKDDERKLKKYFNL